VATIKYRLKFLENIGFKIMISVGLYSRVQVLFSLHKLKIHFLKLLLIQSNRTTGNESRFENVHSDIKVFVLQ